MRIQSDAQFPGYPPVPAALRPVVPRRDAGAATQANRAPLAVYVAEQNPVDVVRGVSARAQRAIAAYTQNDVFEQRMQYAQLLGVDVYA